MKKETVTLEDAKEQVRRVCKRLGLLHLSFAKTLVEEFGEKKGKQLILKAIKDYGIRNGETVKAAVAAQGLDDSIENIMNYDGDLPSYGMHDRVEWVEGDGEEIMKAYGCVMGKVWNELGEGELGRLYCYVDPAQIMACNNNYKLIHTKCTPDGDDYCGFAIRPTTEQERKDFADKDSDWSYIDK